MLGVRFGGCKQATGFWSLATCLWVCKDVCTNMCMHVCMHACTDTSMQPACIYTCIQHAHVCKHVHIHTCRCIHMHWHAYTYIRIHTCIHTYIHTNIRTYIHKYIPSYSYIYVYAHRPIARNDRHVVGMQGAKALPKAKSLANSHQRYSYCTWLYALLASIAVLLRL